MSKKHGPVADIAEDPTAPVPAPAEAPAAPIPGLKLARERRTLAVTKVSPRYAYSCELELGGYVYGPYTVTAVDESEAKVLCLNQYAPQLWKQLTKLVFVAKRESNIPVNVDQLTAVQIEALPLKADERAQLSGSAVLV